MLVNSLRQVIANQAKNTLSKAIFVELDTVCDMVRSLHSSAGRVSQLFTGKLVPDCDQGGKNLASSSQLFDIIVKTAHTQTDELDLKSMSASESVKVEMGCQTESLNSESKRQLESFLKSGKVASFASKHVQVETSFLDQSSQEKKEQQVKNLRDLVDKLSNQNENLREQLVKQTEYCDEKENQFANKNE